jgi:hypothetical protein
MRVRTNGGGGHGGGSRKTTKKQQNISMLSFTCISVFLGLAGSMKCSADNEN